MQVTCYIAKLDHFVPPVIVPLVIDPMDRHIIWIIAKQSPVFAGSWFWVWVGKQNTILYMWQVILTSVPVEGEIVDFYLDRLYGKKSTFYNSRVGARTIKEVNRNHTQTNPNTTDNQNNTGPPIRNGGHSYTITTRIMWRHQIICRK